MLCWNLTSFEAFGQDSALWQNCDSQDLSVQFPAYLHVNLHVQQFASASEPFFRHVLRAAHGFVGTVCWTQGPSSLKKACGRESGPKHLCARYLSRQVAKMKPTLLLMWPVGRFTETRSSCMATLTLVNPHYAWLFSSKFQYLYAKSNESTTFTMSILLRRRSELFTQRSLRDELTASAQEDTRWGALGKDAHQ